MVEPIPNPFFNAVMALRPALPSPKRKKAPKGKGKSGVKAPGFETGPDIKKLDVFRVVLEADAGGESAGGDQIFDVCLARLSKSQLSRLQRKIARLREICLPHSEEEKTLKQAEGVIKRAVTRRLARSDEHDRKLTNSIQKKLDRLEVEKIFFSSAGRVKQVKIGGELFSIAQLIREWFSEEVDAYDEKVLKGDIIIDRLRNRGFGFVSRVLESALAEMADR